MGRLGGAGARGGGAVGAEGLPAAVFVRWRGGGGEGSEGREPAESRSDGMPRGSPAAAAYAALSAGGMSGVSVRGGMSEGMSWPPLLRDVP